MSDAALSRIANLIKLEDDLVKIPTLRQQFTKEKSSIDVKLNTTVQQQIESITSNMYKLNESATSLNEIKHSLNKIGSVYDESTGIPDYELIKKVTALNQFLTQTNNLCRDISGFRDFVNRLKKMTEAEIEIVGRDISYPLDNIFEIHYNLTQIRNFSDFLLVPSFKFSDDLQSIIARLLLPVKPAVRMFDELLKEVIISLTEAVKDGNTQMAFKLIRIIEHENNEDLKVVLKQKLHLSETLNPVTTNYSQFRSSKRNYMKFFYNKLEESLVETFDQCVEHFAEDRLLVYDNLGWLEDELVFVADTLAPIFPARWDLNGFIQDVYYNKLHNFTMDVIKTDPSAEELLRILAYDTHYGKFITSLQAEADTTGKSKKEIKSIVGEELKKVVLDDYLKVIISKMEEWNDNLIRQESEDFVQRDSPPETYTYKQAFDDEAANDQTITLEVESDVFVLPDFKTPLTMLKEQADVAADSGYGSILVGVIQNWSRCYVKRIVNYKLIIEDEFEKYMSVYNNDRFITLTSSRMRFFKKLKPEEPLFDIENMSPDELAAISKPGLIEYLTALGNTYEINTDRLQDKFLVTYKNKVHSSYQGVIQEAFEDTVTPSTELNGQVIRAIIDIITNDLYPALSKVFTKEWYDDKQNPEEPSMVQQVLETIYEYMQDLRGYASYDIYLCTFALLLDAFIASYIRIGYQNILNGKAKKVDPTATKKFKSFSEGVGRDVTLLYGGLESLFTRRDSAYLLNSLRAIEFLGDLATCDDPLNFIPQMWENEILGSFYFCSVEYIRGICLCRKDMDKAQVNILIPVLEDIQRTYHANVTPPPQITGTLNEFYYN